MAKLQEKTLIVDLSISMWKGRKLDKQVTRETQQARGASQDSCTVNKNLIAKDAIDKVYQIATKIRKYNYSVTVPWNDQGARLLKADYYFEYLQKMAELKSEWWDAVNELYADYPALIRDAEYNRLKGGLFNRNDYPTMDKLRKLFGFDLNIDPLPETDFRVNLGNDEVEKLQAEAQTRFDKRMADAMGDVWQRLYKVVSAMAETLSDPDKGFHETKVTNISDLVDLMDVVNITNDENLTRISQDARKRLCKYDADVLKKDKDLRKSVAKEAAEVLDAMAAYMGAA